MANWNAFTHKILRDSREIVVTAPRPLYLAVSGGLDSMLLAQVFQELRAAVKCPLEVVHFHHGGPGEYRHRAALFVTDWCRQQQLPLQVVQSPVELQQEQAMRDFRQEYRRQLLVTKPLAIWVTAHHADDLLETQMLRWMRGVGPRGWQAMRPFAQSVWRPFLRTPRAELEQQARERRLSWVEDPSNGETHYERNWVRHELLPMIEARRPGSVAQMTQSLLLLAEDAASQNDWSEAEFSLSDYTRYTRGERRRRVAASYVLLKVFDFSRNHVEEVCRHLDKGQIGPNVKIGQLIWTINAGQVIPRQVASPANEKPTFG